MVFLGVLCVVVVVVVAVAVARGRLSAEPSDAAPDAAATGLPAGRLRADDVEAVRLPVALRGYRMADVDDVLDRLADALRRRDAEIERLRSGARAADRGV